MNELSPLFAIGRTTDVELFQQRNVMQFKILIQPWRGGGAIPSRAPVGRVVRGGIGGAIALLMVAWLAGMSGLPLILGSFGDQNLT